MAENTDSTQEAKGAIPNVVKKVAKEVLGEGAEIVASGVVAGGLLALLKKVFTKATPKVQEHIEKKIEKELSDTTTRTDEGRFFLTLTELPNVLGADKDLFGKLYYEMRNPNTCGKAPEELAELDKRSKYAKGLIFLINQVYIDNGPDKRTSLAAVNKIWYGIFREIDTFTTPEEKLKILEERILQHGQSNKENDHVSDALGKLRRWDAQFKPTEAYKGLGNNILGKFKKMYGR